jgi:predicted DNA-binding protein
MELNAPEERMTDTVSVRLTRQERVALEELASREERTVSNYLRKYLRSCLDQPKGTKR